MAARQKKERAGKPQGLRGTPARPPKTGIGMLLRDADTAFNRYLTAQLAAHRVTFGQFQHLRNLWVEDGLTQAELSRRIGIEMASSTAILDSLAAGQLITRVRNAADRRKINVFLTPSGAALEKALMACAAGAVTCFTPDALRRAVDNARDAGADEFFLVPTTSDPDELARTRDALDI